MGQKETAKDLNLAPQNILVLLHLSTMTILLLPDSVLMLDMGLQVVLKTVMELLVVLTLGMEHLQALALGMELLQEQVQGTLLLVRPMLVFNHQEAGQGRGQGKDLGSRDLLVLNALI